ncbi:HD domain-containing protein [Dehalobacter sp. DCM]|uniref:HD domain-containing phosphohydrolase n=1 Tax=Dehalobacter sp. DCM TaxID=2907827 RepID=UPI003081616C|nr:HD domain-containing protein [Dehalobacter sp. DCM]
MSENTRNLIDSLNKRLIYEQLINKISNIATKKGNFDDCLNQCLCIIGETLSVSRVILFEYLNGKYKANIWESNVFGDHVNSIQYTYAYYLSLFENRSDSIIISNTDNIPHQEFKKVILNQKVKSILIIPLIYSNKSNGYIILDVLNTYREWLEMEVKCIESIAKILCLFLKNNELTNILIQDHKQYCDIYDSINAGVYISDIEDYKILYANKYLINLCGKDPTGMECYKALHNKDHPCFFCTNNIISKFPDRPCIWEFNNTYLHKYLQITNKIIKWKAEKNARFEYMIDISSLKELQNELSIEKDEIKSSQEMLKEANKKLHNLLSSTIKAISELLEQKDSYTSDHQKNVAKLACDIARKMELPDDQIEGIKIASLLHDIGKIAIPLDILNKPHKLLESEYSLIKEHVINGYNIVKDINFDWPIADIVLQHHERINGSGYPNGLKKKEILLEAKILAVADTIEAMSSHRPYRPKLGVSEAIEEIKRNSNILYDEEVVKASLSLLEEDYWKALLPNYVISKYDSFRKHINKLNIVSYDT